MNTFTRFLTLGLFSAALAAAPVVSKVYAAPDNDPPPSNAAKKKKKSSELRPGIRTDRVRGQLSRGLCYDLRSRRIRFRHRAVEGAAPRR